MGVDLSLRELSSKHSGNSSQQCLCCERYESLEAAVHICLKLHCAEHILTSYLGAVLHDVMIISYRNGVGLAK